ncbi:protein turtle homolog B-like isoform X2 [Oppia nitens]|uniref:protein turtle homolog B-like isoform X2 n=1 Tax=Oppia nitens TaxID=1686743 RepID=UPI0023D9AB15|nr:protein turtle homolog B-like isoform X2 [Oppia nitens]
MMSCHKDLCLIFTITSILWSSLWTHTIQGFVQNNEEPEHISSNYGENVIINCAFDFPDGIRVPYVIQWQKNGVKIPIYIWYDGYPPHIGEGYEGRVSLSGQAALNLSNLNENDQGWYECKVFFLNRPPEPIKNGTWVHLDVHAPPHFRLKPPDVIYVKVGETITMPCEAMGTPSPAIIWYKDNQPLEGSGSVHILPNELRISNLQQSDIGDYMCLARNREGSTTANTKVIIAGPAVITAPPRNQTRLEGDQIEMICEAKALPSNVTHRWLHNGIDISQLSWLETRTIIRRDGTLFINPSTAEDSGQYTCEVSNGIGISDTASAYLSVEYPARVTYSPTIQYLPHGLSGIVRCFIQAMPPFQFITWTKDRRPFDPNATPGVVTLNNGSLLFQRVSHEHQGRYRCTPYNLHGTAGTSNAMEVLVREPPKFTIRPNDMYQRSVNSEVVMPCDGVGQPKPNIIWRKADGNKLPKDRAFIRSGNLTIKSIKKEDHGIYECILENEIAILIATTLLLVNNTTPHPPQNVSVNTSAFAATVQWIPNYNGGYEQTYHLRYRLSDSSDSDWKTIRVPPPESLTAFTLYNLQSDAEYDFQVFASNRLGVGMTSPIVRTRTKMWDLQKTIYPTDAYGATYIPTVQKPSGPKPGAPRNVSIEKMAQGWVISWLSPVDKSVAVAYYRIEFKENDKRWQYSEPIAKDNAFLIKNLDSGTKYTFRVWAYSILGNGEVSDPFDYKISGPADGIKGARAITAGIVGSVLFFVTAIVLSVCIVKICNKRKRRKMEKAYMMVTCPVMDGINGGHHTHGDSPVPLKQRAKRGISGLIHVLIRSLLQRFGAQHYCRRPTEPRHVAGRDSSPLGVPTIETIGSNWRDNVIQVSPPARRRAMKNVRYNVEMEYSRPLGWISRTSDGKFVVKGQPILMKNIGYNTDEQLHAYDLTPSNQASVRGSFRSDGSGQSGPNHTNVFPLHRHHSQFSRSSTHSSLPSRSQRNQSFSPQSYSFRSGYNISQVFRPRDPRFRTSSPGPGLPPDSLSMEQELSSVRQTSSSFERSSQIPMISSPSLRSQLQELPALRPIHEHLHRHNNHSMSQLRATVPISRQPNIRAINRGPLLLETVPEAIYDAVHITPKYDSPSARRGDLWTDGRHLHIPQPINQSTNNIQLLRDVPTISARAMSRPYQNVPFPRHLIEESVPQYKTQQSLDDPIDEMRFIAPPKMVFKKPRAPPPPPSLSQQKTIDLKSDFNTTVSSDSSNDQPFQYTRDKLLGAVEKVRSGMLLTRASPFRHEGSQTPTSVQTPSQTPIDRRLLEMPEPLLRPRRPTPVKFADDNNVFIDDHHNQPTYRSSHPQPPSRASLTSQSSGRGSAGQDGSGKTTLVSNSRGNSFQNSPQSELQSVSNIDKTASSSSGIASQTMSSQLHSSTSPGQSSGISATSTSATPNRYVKEVQSIKQSFLPKSIAYQSRPTVESPQSEPIFPSYAPPMEPLDVSVDENYEFDSISPLEAELIEKLRREQQRWSQWQQQQQYHYQPQHYQQQQQQSIRGPFSDSEVYSTVPIRRRYEDTDARCAALKEEFFRFRRRQQLLQQQQQRHRPSHEELSSSDEFESAC